MGVCTDMGVKLYARFRSEREDWVQAMVMANIGFTFVPEFSVTHPDSIRRPLIDPAVKSAPSASLPFPAASIPRPWPPLSMLSGLTCGIELPR